MVNKCLLKNESTESLWLQVWDTSFGDSGIQAFNFCKPVRTEALTEKNIEAILDLRWREAQEEGIRKMSYPIWGIMRRFKTDWEPLVYPSTFNMKTIEVEYIGIPINISDNTSEGTGMADEL